LSARALLCSQSHTSQRCRSPPPPALTAASTATAARARRGFDFRPEYRRLGEVRDALPGVPFVALTATATPKVRDDIAASLRLRPGAERWVESFERTNLALEVKKKGAGVAAALTDVVAAAAAGALEPTLVYTVSRREAEEAAAALRAAHPALADKVGVYHGSLSIGERERVHAEFLRDRLPVVCATLAFGALAALCIRLFRVLGF
jgi:ATP-dependent DNA helicase RecQ